MATVAGAAGRASGFARSTQYKKSARVSARAFAQSGMLGKNVARRKTLGGKGG